MPTAPLPTARLNLPWSVGVHELLCQALRERRPLRAQYGGTPVVLWPYALGRRAGLLYVRGLMVGGPFRDEHWIFIRDLRQARLAEPGGWVAPGTNPIPALDFFDRVEAACEEYLAWLHRRREN